MASSQESQTEKLERVNPEINEIEDWTKLRVFAYRRQRDFWQRVTNYLLALSAITAIGAAVAGGLAIRLWAVIFAGVSAGISVINASLKTGTQIANSEKDLSTVSLLRANASAFKTDLQGLSTEILEGRLVQLRKEYEEALKLPQPSEKQLRKAAEDSRAMPSWLARALGSSI